MAGPFPALAPAGGDGKTLYTFTHLRPSPLPIAAPSACCCIPTRPPAFRRARKTRKTRKKTGKKLACGTPSIAAPATSETSALDGRARFQALGVKSSAPVKAAHLSFPLLDMHVFVVISLMWIRTFLGQMGRGASAETHGSMCSSNHLALELGIPPTPVRSRRHLHEPRSVRGRNEVSLLGQVGRVLSLVYTETTTYADVTTLNCARLSRVIAWRQKKNSAVGSFRERSLFNGTKFNMFPKG